MGRPSDKFDRQLFTLKLSELSHQMQIKSVASDRKPGSGSVLANIVEGQLALLRDEWLAGVDRIAREVRQIQGEAVTPEFVRETLLPEALALIGARESTVKSNVTLASQRTHLEDPHDALHHLAIEIRKLQGEVAGRYEIEARELEYQKAPATPGSPQTQLDQQGSIHGLIEDATRDTTLWLQTDSSAEEKAYVLAIQGRLADLARIIRRRMECRGSPEHARQWSETVAEVLLLLEKAREVRGNIVGKGLGRIAARLPKELPATKPPKRLRVRIPPPIKPVNTSGGIWLGPPAAQKHHEWGVAMEYPGDFPAESRAKVEAARIRAGRRFDSDKAKAKWNSDIERLFKSYVLTMFLTFAKEALRLRLWPVDKMREKCQEFLRLLTIEAYFQKGKAAGLRDMISNWNGSILWEFQQEIEKTPQWRKFENILLKLAAGSTGEKQAESPAQNSANATQTERKAEAEFGDVLTAIGGRRGSGGWVAAALGNGVKDKPFTHSEDYRTVTVRSETYTLTSEQTAMIQILHKAHENGTPDISIAHILEELNKESSRWQDTFKSNPTAKRALVRSGKRKGTLRLNL